MPDRPCSIRQKPYHRRGITGRRWTRTSLLTYELDAPNAVRTVITIDRELCLFLVDCRFIGRIPTGFPMPGSARQANICHRRPDGFLPYQCYTNRQPCDRRPRPLPVRWGPDSPAPRVRSGIIPHRYIGINGWRPRLSNVGGSVSLGAIREAILRPNGHPRTLG